MAKPKQGKKVFETVSGLPLDEVYGQQSCGDESTRTSVPQDSLPNPGTYPYTRGIHQTMYRGRNWTMRQYAGFGTASEANARYKFLLKQGTTGLSVAFDLPTQMGRDADHPLSRGEVGKVGVSISSIEDMRELLDGIPLEAVSVSMTINSTAMILLGFLLVVAEEQGVPWGKLRGTIQNDILKEYIARGTYIYPPKPAMRIVTDIFQFCTANVPKWNTISISGYHIREAGSTAPEELAFTLANGIAYVEAALAAGLDVDEFAPRLAFFFNCHNDFLEEVSKFRAARKLWAQIMKERFGAKEPKSLMLRFHTQTAGSSLTAQQPYNNIVRTTVQALAAVCGGTQSLHTNSFDEALGLPTEESAGIALRTQQIIANESGITNTVDPLGGSYVIEHLTEKLIEEAELRISKIDALGGMLSAIEQGYPQEEIEQSAYRYQQRVESSEQIIVGMNLYQDAEEVSPPIAKMDPKGEKDQCERLGALRQRRDEKQVATVLKSLREAAAGDGNLVEVVVQAVRCEATLGEISDVLRDVFGEYGG